MKRIAIVGNIGAGKTSLARRLGHDLGLGNVHLDRVYWQPGWSTLALDEFARQHHEIIQRDSWIIDGNYTITMRERFEAADAVFFLDYPRRVSYWRLLRRNVRYLFRQRDDLPAGCFEIEKIGHAVKHVWRFPVLTRPAILENLGRLDRGKLVFHVRSAATLRRAVAQLIERAGQGA